MSSTAQIATRPNQRTLGRDVVAGFSRAGGDEPAEHFTDGDAERVGVPGDTGHRHRSVRGPPRRRRARGREHRGDLVGSRERCSWAGSPHDHSTGFPRGLQLDRAGSEDLVLGIVAVAGPSGPTVSRFHAAANRRCSDSRSATTCARSSPLICRALGEVLLRVAQETRQRRAPRELVGSRAPRSARASPRRRLRARRTCRAATVRALWVRARTVGSPVGLDVTSRDHVSPLPGARRPKPCASSKKNGSRCRPAASPGSDGLWRSDPRSPFQTGTAFGTSVEDGRASFAPPRSPPPAGPSVRADCEGRRYHPRHSPQPVPRNGTSPPQCALADHGRLRGARDRRRGSRRGSVRRRLLTPRDRGRWKARRWKIAWPRPRAGWRVPAIAVDEKGYRLVAGDGYWIATND